MGENPTTEVSKAGKPISEKQQLVAGVFASKAAAEAAMEKIKGLSSQLQVVNASNILILAKGDKGKIDINIIDIGSTSEVNIAMLAERIAVDLIASETIGCVIATNLRCEVGNRDGNCRPIHLTHSILLAVGLNFH